MVGKSLKDELLKYFDFCHRNHCESLQNYKIKNLENSHNIFDVVSYNETVLLALIYKYEVAYASKE